MNQTHSTEADIQAYALGETSLVEHEHIISCPDCAARVEHYRVLFSTLKELPKPGFDFDVTALILPQLPMPATIQAGSERWVFITIFLALALLGLPVYMEREYLFRMFSDIGPVSLYTITLASLAILGFQCLVIYRKYRKQMRALDL